jgi:hypothetical protein
MPVTQAHLQVSEEVSVEKLLPLIRQAAEADGKSPKRLSFEKRDETICSHGGGEQVAVVVSVVDAPQARKAAKTHVPLEVAPTILAALDIFSSPEGR